MKEDILEQLVDDYLQSLGYFTRHNIKFRPAKGAAGYDSKKDSNHSDIDVIGIHPLKEGADKVWVVSCKSWQAGFDIAAEIAAIENEKIRSGRDAWKRFRELLVPRWSEAFVRAVNDTTGQTAFTYVTAVTFTKGRPHQWERYAKFTSALNSNPIRILTLQEILQHLDQDDSTTVAASAIGRTLQLMRAAKKGAKALEREVTTQVPDSDT